MERHEKLAKLAELKKRREDKALKKNKKLQQELYEYECRIEEHKQKMQYFLEQRSVKIQRLQNKMKTESMDGQAIEAYLLLKEDTQEKTKELYAELEHLTQNYYPLLDKVNESYTDWEVLNISRTKLDGVVTDRTEIYRAEKALEEEMNRYNDFFGTKSPSE